MRLVSTFEDQKHAYQLSAFLRQQGIDNQLEITTNTDWDSADYGKVLCRIWVIDEDQFENSLKLTEEFQQDPENSRFYVPLVSPVIAPSGPPKAIAFHKKSREIFKKQPLGTITLSLAILCSLLLLISTMTAPLIRPLPQKIPYTPVFLPPLNKALMYDYPQAYEWIDRLVNAYGIEGLENPETLPLEGKYFLQQFFQTPYWRGLYEQWIETYKNGRLNFFSFDAPMFEKIQEGEWWRLFTPCLLHSDLFHLFFNMIWLIILGRQIEQRLGAMRYLFFILAVAIFSNTAQYLVSGMNFLGFSGVLCGMLTFIWTRQRLAAWEGYQLDRGTIAFIVFFVLFMFSLQVISFFLEIYIETTLPIGIANTAHLSGAFMGFIFAYAKKDERE